LIRRDALHLPSVFVTDEVLETDAEPFVPVIDAILPQFESHQRARTTRQKDGFKWQSQLLANLGFYARRRVPASWRARSRACRRSSAARARRSTSRCTR